jgi:hypothetical protein
MRRSPGSPRMISGGRPVWGGKRSSRASPRQEEGIQGAEGELRRPGAVGGGDPISGDASELGDLPRLPPRSREARRSGAPPPPTPSGGSPSPARSLTWMETGSPRGTWTSPGRTSRGGSGSGRRTPMGLASPAHVARVRSGARTRRARARTATPPVRRAPVRRSRRASASAALGWSGPWPRRCTSADSPAWASPPDTPPGIPRPSSNWARRAPDGSPVLRSRSEARLAHRCGPGSGTPPTRPRPRRRGGRTGPGSGGGETPPAIRPPRPGPTPGGGRRPPPPAPGGSRPGCPPCAPGPGPRPGFPPRSSDPGGSRAPLAQGVHEEVHPHAKRRLPDFGRVSVDLGSSHPFPRSVS